MMEGWFFMTAALLVLSGGSKVRDPEPTRGALRAAGLPSSGAAVMLLAILEIAAGATAFAVPHVIPALVVAALYAGFALFVVVALQKGLPLRSCGCFGRSDTPPGPGHVVVNVLAAAGALIVAAGGGAEITAVLTDQPAAGVPYLGFVGLGATLLALILADLPAVVRRQAP